jgi:hypothetical protein
MNLSVETLFGFMQESQKRYAKYTEQIQKVTEIFTTLHSIQMGMEQTAPVMQGSMACCESQNQPLDPFMRPDQEFQL